MILIGFIVLNGCTSYKTVISSESLKPKVHQLTQSIINIDPSVDPLEAHKVARVAVYYPLQLRQEYQLVDSPLIHNALVNAGIKKRGLCIHWTEDLLNKLAQLDLRTLKLNWLVANQDASLRLEHSAVLVNSYFTDMRQGIVLDAWRDSGEIFFDQVSDDHYQWQLEYNDITARLLLSDK